MRSSSVEEWISDIKRRSNGRPWDLFIVWRDGQPAGGDHGTNDVEVIPATEEERAEELLHPDVAKGLEKS